MNRAAMWQELRVRGLVQSELPVDHSIPWPVRIMLGLGAWLGSLLSLVFLALFFDKLVEDTPGRLVLAALAAFGASRLIHQSATRPFVGQIGMVLACMMQTLLVVSVFDDVNGAAGGLLIALIAIGSMWLPSRLWRVWCTWLMLFALAWFVQSIGVPLGLAGMIGLSAAASAWLWLHPQQLAQRFELYWPIALGLSLGTFGLSAWNPSLWWATFFVADHGAVSPLGMATTASVLLGLVNAGLVVQLGERVGARRTLMGAALVLLIAAASFSTPAVSAALGLLLLGFGRGQWVLSASGVLGMLLALGAHYYGLNWTLNMKALSMVSLGVLLLAARVLLGRPSSVSGAGGAHA